MEPCLSMSVRFGSGAGRLLWLADRCTFSLRLRFDDLDGVGAELASPCPPTPVGPSVELPHLVVGGRPGQFITVDRLVNQLRLYGLEPDTPSSEALPEFRGLVSRTFGDAEIVGVTRPGPLPVARRLAGRADDRDRDRAESSGPPVRLGPSIGWRDVDDGDRPGAGRALLVSGMGDG